MDLQLLCCEGSTTENRAYIDKILLSNRVLDNLLKHEDHHLYPGAIENVQHEVTTQMRKIVSEWMMEVCDEQNCQDEVFLMAMNYMDRFLSVQSIGKSQLQLLGTACMLIASKLREPQPLPAKTLVFYTDNSITVEDLRKCELIVVSKLKWDLSVVTAQDFVTQILRRLPIESVGIEYNMVNNHAKTLIALCTRDHNFSKHLPSTLASACIASALCGLGWIAKSGRTPNDLLNLLKEIVKTDEEFIIDCYNRLEKMIRLSSWAGENNHHEHISDNIDNTFGSSCSGRPGQFTPPPGSAAEKLPNQEPESAGTPTDVRDVHF